MKIEAEQQRQFWNDWNAQTREKELHEISRRQAEMVIDSLERTGRSGLKILEVGCGAGWLCPELARFGDVVGTDLSDEVLQRAQTRWPEIKFVSGDFFSLSFEPQSFDVIVSLEVLSHVENQPQFMERLADLLVPGGMLLLATQNRPVLQKHCSVAPPGPGQVRRWVDRTELAGLASPFFKIEQLRSITPMAQRGYRRFLTSQKLNNALAPVMGHRLRDLLEANDWGWTLMLRATRHLAV